MRRTVGATMIEMMVAITITLVGFIGLLDLQTAGIQGATEGRGIFLAVQLADHFAETLRTEAIEWTQSVTLNGNIAFPHLKSAPAASDGATSDWVIATDAYVGPMASFDEDDPYCNAGVCDKAVIGEIPDDQDANYCIHYRLTWLVANQLLRGDVRIVWSRAGQDRDKTTNCALSTADDSTIWNVMVIPVTLIVNVFTSS